MGDIGVPELLIILAIVLVCFGPSRLSGLGKSLGEGIRSFREGVRDLEPVAPAEAAPLPAAENEPLSTILVPLGETHTETDEYTVDGELTHAR